MNLSTSRRPTWSGVYRVITDQMFLFTASRYMGYALQFVRGILVAKFLGPYLFGIWGFLMLISQYLSYSSLGLQFAVSVELATDSVSNSEKQRTIVGTALLATLVVVVFLSLSGFGLQVSNIQLFEKYSFNRYALALSVMVGLTHLQELFKNVYRVYKQFTRIAIGEVLSASLPLIAVLVFDGEELIPALLVIMSLSAILSIAIFAIHPPFKVSLSFDLHVARSLLALGIPLLIYNLSYYLITAAGRTVIGIFYPVETMGYYSFANNITNAILLGLKAMSWAVLPDILFRVRSDEPAAKVSKVVQRINDIYGTSVFLTAFGTILALPLLFVVLPQYRPVGSVLSILLLSQAILSISFGYNCVAVARKKQLKIASISLFAVIIVTGLSLLSAYLGGHFIWTAVAVLIGSFVFTLLQGQLGSEMLAVRHTPSNYFNSMLPIGSFIAALFLLVGSLLGYPTWGGVGGLVVFSLTNRRRLGIVWRFALDRIHARMND